MRPEPDINAIHVERVGTERERTDVVAVFELQEAYYAVTALSVGFGSID